MLDFNKNARTEQITTADMKVISWDKNRNGDLYRYRVIPIVEVISKNKLRWIGNDMMREKESTPWY